MEAKQACWDWVEKGGVFYVWYPADENLFWNGYSQYVERTDERNIRNCFLEEETNQWIGSSSNGKKGKTYRYGEDDLAKIFNPKVKKVIKRFKW